MENSTKILIVEDENIIAKDISKTVERLGYSVVGTARTGKNAIEKAKELQPNLILMDIMLEGEMNGIEASKQILTFLDVPIIYLTALTDEETLNKAKITEPFGYIIKPYDKRALHNAIEMATYKHYMNNKLRQRTKELEIEKEKSIQLLENIFPKDIVKELKETGVIAPKQFEMVSLMFTDFQGFTSISSKMPPQKLVKELNEIFMNFDSIIEKYGLEKLKIIGDSYMVGGGFPKQTESHAVNIVSTALEMIEYLKERNKSSENKWEMRVGVHSGSVIAGVVGKNKYTYDVWGNSVHIASMMEKLGIPGEVNITKATYELIKDYYNCESRGEVELSGNGMIEMFVVKERASIYSKS